MTRTIKASEVKPGMEVEFTHTRRMKVCYSYRWNDFEHGLEGVSGDVTFVDADTQVTVLSEPAPPQPEEPTELGVKARVREGRFLRLREGLEGSNVWFEEGTGYRWTWDDLCEMGPVTVVPDQGWTVPDDTPEVPERIDEWPEDDTALRKHKWRDRDGDTWTWIEDRVRWECRDHSGDYQTVYSRPYSWCRPWTRVTDV